jgi:hypothetical protein
MGLLNAFKQYVRDAMPGGALNPEVTPQGLLDSAALGTAPVPIVGDVLGLLADGKRLRDSPEERTLGNYGLSALGLLPFVPAMGTIKSVAKAPQADALDAAQKNAVKMLGLPPNNTPMDRAKALGFVDDAVHFSRHGIDVNELDSGKFAVAPFDAVGTHVGTKEAALDRFRNTVATTDQIKGSSYPVLIKKGEQFISPKTGGAWAEDDLSSALFERGGYATAKDTFQSLNQKLRRDIFRGSGYDSIPYVNDVEAKGAISYIVPPHNIRSRFAAFDPARINENDLLGRVNLPMLGLLGAGGLGGAYLLRPEE